jgi:ATP-binding cassette, subfamily B, bacterial IrtA/YbtP
MSAKVSPESAAGAAAPLGGLGSLLALERGLVALGAVSATLAAALGLVPFFVVARMATAIYAEPSQLEEVRSLAALTAVALAARYLFIGAANVLAHVAAFRILHELRVRLAHKLGRVPLAFFGRHGAGELKKTLMDDVNQIEAFVAHHFPDGVAAVIIPLSTAAALLWVDWRMALASVAVAPLAILAMAVAMRGAGEAQRQWHVLQDGVNGALLEYLRGITVIKSFGLSAARFGDLTRSIEAGSAWMVRFMRTNGRGYGAFGTLIGSSLLVLLPAGGWFYAQGTLSLESLVLFLVLGPQLLTSLLRLMFAWGNIERIQAGNARIRAILDTPDVEDDAALPGAAARTQAREGFDVTFRQVGFRYDVARHAVLEGVSFDVPAGKITALVGPSGAGKTTLVRLIPRFWDPDCGAVTLGGVDVRELPLDELLSHVSLVFQDVFLFHGTVRENLRLGRPTATDDDIEAACRAARADEFIGALPQGYDTPLGERGARLSGGERQRLSIARALLKNAPVLLLDEATAFADPESEACIQDALSVLCRGRTVLIVAHRLATIVNADQIVVLDHGRVQGTGTHAELLESCPPYRELWTRHRGASDWSIAAAAAERNVEVA